MSRVTNLNAEIARIGPTGLPEDLGIDSIHEVENLPRYLLVERNLGSAAHMQSHYFTVHETLEEAGAYHAGQEYAEDWQVEHAVDLDTGEQITGALYSRFVWESTADPLAEAWATVYDYIEGHAICDLSDEQCAAVDVLAKGLPGCRTS